jgi:acyl carrier protein
LRPDTFDYLVKLINSVVEDRVVDLSADTTIEELDLDSLDEVELLMSIEDQMKIELDQAEVNSCPTIGSLASLIEAKISR